MCKIILFMLLLIASGLVYPEPRTLNNNKMTFREFAKLSAIISQCEIKNIIQKEDFKKFSKLQGLKLAKENKLSQHDIATEVSLILFELDQNYPEVIPESVCENTIKTFKDYKKIANFNFQ